MSVVEKTLRKLQDARKSSSDPAAGTAASTDSNARMPSGGKRALETEHLPWIIIDRAALRASGLLPPTQEERRLSSQYRKIKRPLIANAFGRGVERVPNGHVIMLASAMPGEGKTFTALNLALSIAKEKDLNVLLVDADVPKPHLSRKFGLEGEQGLLDLLRDPQLDVDAVVRQTDIPTLTFLPAGKNSGDATELLASKRMEELIEQFGERDSHRIVLFDTPPLMQTTESPALAHVAGQVLVVVRAESTPQPVVLDALESLQDHPAVSLVLNQSMRSENSAYYYSGYGDASSDLSSTSESD